MKRRATVFVPDVILDHVSRVPIHEQIFHAMSRAIRDEDVPSHTRLLSSRVFAKLLGVSRNTVLAAYDNLAAVGLIEGKRGSGMQVCRSASQDPTLFSLRQAIRESGFPARVLSMSDCDGNPLYLRY